MHIRLSVCLLNTLTVVQSLIIIKLLFYYLLRLVDVCQLYTVLEDVDRDITHVTQSPKCDQRLIQGWYRFLNDPGIRMPTSCPRKYRCGTKFPGWLNGDHPTVDEGVVTREVCLHRNDCSCKEIIYGIKVKNCGSFYVYNLFGGPSCSWRYCYTSN